MTGGITLGFDRCIDWTNPQFPAFSVSGSLAFNLASNVGDAVKQIIIDTIDDSIDGFLDPSSLLGDMIGFSPSDFF